jgi:hypothetical protein
MSPIRVLCLFTSPELREASFFAAREGHWVTDIDQGRCELVPLVLDGDAATLATSGLFAAATLLCRPADLGPGVAPRLRSGALAFGRARIPFEVVAAEGPVSVIAWLAENAPELVARCQADGEVRPESPSWWRERVRRHLAAGESVAPAVAEEDLGAQLADFVRRRGW